MDAVLRSSVYANEGGWGWNHFTKALDIVARVIREAPVHPDNDWIRRSPDFHLGRAEEHLRLWRDGDQLQDHVSHAATRLLMALTLRELE